MKRKNGFTLVELIAVIVILIIIMLITIPAVQKGMEKSKINVVVKDAITFQKGALEKYSSDKSTDMVMENLFHNAIPGKVCYSIDQQLLGTTVEKSGSVYTGSVEVCYKADCEYSTKIWLTDGEHFIDGVSDLKDASQISDSFSTDYPNTCGVEALGGGGSGGDLVTAEFEQKNSEYKMKIVKDGVYALEAWGAQGMNCYQTRGGYGGYAYAEVMLKEGDMLFINVGGQGEGPVCGAGQNQAGGYNGGGLGRNGQSGGGGATSIAKQSGLLNKPVLKDYLYVVAGGGGAGTSSKQEGYSGGGIADESNSATQSSGSYGWASGNKGCGGGLYGSTSNSDPAWRSAGGSGYIGNPLNRNAVMYAYNGVTSDAAATKTISTTNISEKPISGYAKMGPGFAKVTYLGDNFTNNP